MNTENSQSVVAVLGGGAWGSTLADLLARKGTAVRIWERAPAMRERLERDRHPFGVPELRLHESVRIDGDMAEAIEGAGVILFVISSQAVGEVSRAVKQHLDNSAKKPIIVLASKGIDIATLSPLSAVVEHEIPGIEVGVLSGPCIAVEVARRAPTSAVAASPQPETALMIQELFATQSLRVYTQDDVVGVELGGALKNIIAIAAGIGDGLGFGANSKAALMTRGLAEMARLATAMGARHNTLFGMAGLGDLAVTCFSPHSRNRTFGEYLGQGKSCEEARDAVGMIVEGEPTARAATKLARKYNIELPITSAVINVCDGTWAPMEAVRNLMGRELKEEFWDEK